MNSYFIVTIFLMMSGINLIINPIEELRIELGWVFLLGGESLLGIGIVEYSLKRSSRKEEAKIN